MAMQGEENKLDCTWAQAHEKMQEKTREGYCPEIEKDFFDQVCGDDTAFGMVKCTFSIEGGQMTRTDGLLRSGVPGT
eukprot:s1446_g11.t1